MPAVMDRINVSAIFNISVKFLPTDRPTIFGTLYVPQKLYIIHSKRRQEQREETKSDWRDRRDFAVYEHVAQYATRQYILTASRNRIARCIYASRGGAGTRDVQNEGDVENIYRSYGFFIATPGPKGIWTFEEEVAHYNSAYILAGFEGTNLHNSVFMKPGGTLINMQTDTLPNVNQAHLADMNNLTTHHIDLSKNMTGATVDIDVLNHELGNLADDIRRANCSA